MILGRIGLLLFLSGTIAGCATAGGDIVRPGLRITAADYFPLEVGWKWVYSIWKAGTRTEATFAVLDRNGDVAVVQEGDERLTYAVTREGVAQKEGETLGDYILKEPLMPGTEWPVAGGRAEIVSVDGQYETPIGRYHGCLVVQVTRNDPLRVTQTMFAPYLGMVTFAIEARDGDESLPIAQARLENVIRPGDAVKR